MVGDIEVIDGKIAATKENGLVLKNVEGQQDYFFCKVRLSKDKRRDWLGWPILSKAWTRNLAIKSKKGKVIKCKECQRF